MKTAEGPDDEERCGLERHNREARQREPVINLGMKGGSRGRGRHRGDLSFSRQPAVASGAARSRRPPRLAFRGRAANAKGVPETVAR